VVGLTLTDGVVCYISGVSTGALQRTLFRWSSPSGFVDPLLSDFVEANTVAVNENPTSWIAGTTLAVDLEPAALVCYAIEKGVTCNVLRTVWGGPDYNLTVDSTNLVSEEPTASIALGSSGQAGDSVIMCCYGEVSGKGNAWP